MIRSVDANGDGVVQRTEFEDLCVAPPLAPEGSNPHLILNFDVNQTVLMIDSAIKAVSHGCAMTPTTDHPNAIRNLQLNP